MAAMPMQTESRKRSSGVMGDRVRQPEGRPNGTRQGSAVVRLPVYRERVCESLARRFGGTPRTWEDREAVLPMWFSALVEERLARGDTLGAARAMAPADAAMAGIEVVELDITLWHTASHADAKEDGPLADLGLDLATGTLTPERARKYRNEIAAELYLKQHLLAALDDYLRAEG